MDVGRYGQNRDGGRKRLAEPADQEIGAATAADFANADPIRAAGIAVGHERGMTLVAGEDVANLVRSLVEGVVKHDPGVARYPKDQVDPGLDQAFRQYVCAASFELPHIAQPLRVR